MTEENQMPIPLIDIRYAIQDKKICIKGYKKIKDVDELKAFAELKSRNTIKLKGLKTIKSIHKRIDEFNDYFCITNLIKIKRPELEKIMEKFNIKIDENLRNKAPRKTYGNVFKAVQQETGIKKFFTDKEQKEFISEQKFKDDPFDITIKKGDISEKLALRDNQKKFIEKIIYSNTRGSIAFWGVGTGKTVLTAVSIKLYLQYFPTSNVVFIAPSALLSNLILTMYNYGLNIRDKRIKYFSYEKAEKELKKGSNMCRGSLLIIDEAHNLRTKIEEKGSKILSGSRPKAIIDGCSGIASKVILLTATPVVNTPYDIENLLAMIDGRSELKSDNFQRVLTNQDTSDDYFKLRVSFYKRILDDKDFPRKVEKELFVEMGEKAEKQMKKILNGPDAFYSTSRQFTNTIDDFKKLKAVAKMIKKQKNSRNIIYLAFVENGVKELRKIMKDMGLNNMVVSGNEGAKEKQTAVRNYNNGNIRNIIITKAGAEGLDLKRTTNIFIVDQPWNESTRSQIVGRAVRYKSHADLPLKDRVVNVYNVFNIYPSEKEFISKIVKINNDAKFSILTQVIKSQKKKENEQSKKVEDIDLKLPQFIMISDEEKAEAKKKGLSNAELYKNTFNKYAKELVASKLEPPTNPTIDIRLFIFSKSKQYVINRFEDWLKSIPHFENGISDVEKRIIKKLEKENPKSAKAKYKIYEEELKKIVKDGYKIVTQSNILNKKNIEVMDKQKMDTEKKQQDYLDAKFQEYFTQNKKLEKLYVISDLENDERQQLKTLEPSAGVGNIINYVRKKHLMADFRAVEFRGSNRKELKKLIKALGMTIEEVLYKERDFLKSQISDRFEYVFMNPPFNLEKGNSYTRDVYDIDFIKKAYTLTKKGGVIVGIMYQPHSKKDLKDKIMSENSKWLHSHAEELINANAKFDKHRSNKMVSVPITYFKIVKKDLKEDSKLLTELNKLVKINIKDSETEIVIDDDLEKALQKDKAKAKKAKAKPKAKSGDDFVKSKKEEYKQILLDELFEVGLVGSLYNYIETVDDKLDRKYINYPELKKDILDLRKLIQGKSNEYFKSVLNKNIIKEYVNADPDRYTPLKNDKYYNIMPLLKDKATKKDFYKYFGVEDKIETKQQSSKKEIVSKIKKSNLDNLKKINKALQEDKELKELEEKLDKPKRRYLYISPKEREVRNKIIKLGIEPRKSVNYYYGNWESGVGKKRLRDLEEKLYKLKKDELKELMNRNNLKGLSNKTKDQLIKIILVDPSNYI